MQTKNYLIAIVSIVLIVGIVFFISGQSLSLSSEDISGQAAKVTATKSVVTKTTSTKSTNTKTISSAKKVTTKKQFCGDASCVDGTHVSCYLKKGECECETCKVTPFSKEFQETLNAKSTQSISKEKLSLSKLNINAFTPVCQTEKRYQTGAPIIDAFMMDFLGGLDEKTLNEFAEYLEIAYCNATNGEIVINITAVKYNWTNTSYPKNFTDYQPFMDDRWEYLRDKEDYDDIITLTYDDILSEEDMPRFYYQWLLYKVEDSLTLYYNTFISYANEIGYNEDYDTLIVLSGAVNDAATGYYNSISNIIYIQEPQLHLVPTIEETYLDKTTQLEYGFYSLTDATIHEIGHFTGAAHACEETECSDCSWSNDVMSYCRNQPGRSQFYNGYLGCTRDFFREYYIPNHNDGSTAGGSMDEYSCE